MLIRRIGARERRQLIPHVRFQVSFLWPESQLKSRLQSRLRGSLEAIESTTKEKCKDKGEFSGQASMAEIGANAYECMFLNRFHFHWKKGHCNFTLYMGQCSFLLTVFAFRCPHSVYCQNWQWVRDKNCSCVRISKNTLSRHQPTNPNPEIVSTFFSLLRPISL